MSDPNVNQDPTKTSSFDNEAIDPATAAAARARFDASSADSSDAADEHASESEGIALVTGALEREVTEASKRARAAAAVAGSIASLSKLEVLVGS